MPRNEWIALQLFAIGLQLTGAIMIGNWWTALGIAFMMWGYGVMNAAKLPRKDDGKPKVVKDWLGNQHIES